MRPISTFTILASSPAERLAQCYAAVPGRGNWETIRVTLLKQPRSLDATSTFAGRLRNDAKIEGVASGEVLDQPVEMLAVVRSEDRAGIGGLDAIGVPVAHDRFGAHDIHHVV